MNGAEALLEGLKREGVDTLFGISGGAVLPIYDALSKQKDIWSVLTRHEQGAAFMETTALFRPQTFYRAACAR